jgi:hypothetical protein
MAASRDEYFAKAASWSVVLSFDFDNEAVRGWLATGSGATEAEW